MAAQPQVRTDARRKARNGYSRRVIPIRERMTPKQGKLLRNVCGGMTLADAAIAAGYKCRSRDSAKMTAHITLKRIRGKPGWQDALLRADLSLEVAAQLIKEATQAKEVTTILDARGRVIKTIVRDCWPARLQAVKWVIEAFEGLKDVEEPNPLDRVSDEELEAMITYLRKDLPAESGGQSTNGCPSGCQAAR